MELQSGDLLLIGIAFGILVGFLLAIEWFRAFLSQRRIIYLNKIELPHFFPKGVLQHSYAVPLLIELAKAKREGRKEAHVSQIARWIGTNRVNTSNTVNYLERENFVGVRPTIKKKFVSLTELGEKAGAWLEENLSPDVLSYLERSCDQDILARLLRIRGRRKLDKGVSVKST